MILEITESYECASPVYTVQLQVLFWLQINYFLVKSQCPKFDWSLIVLKEIPLIIKRCALLVDEAWV